MKRIDKIVLVLLTLSLAILTEKLDLSVNDNKLLCTILWCAWLISVAAYYFIITKDWRFEHSVHGGYVIGFAIHIETVNNSKALNIIIPFMVLEFKWTKLN
tara:strand:- start:496 stop:798 length:303 start_codon:yes stop_codon:yes gene_type:complete